jgi:hypothetical protein
MAPLTLPSLPPRPVGRCGAGRAPDACPVGRDCHRPAQRPWHPRPRRVRDGATTGSPPICCIAQFGYGYGMSMVNALVILGLTTLALASSAQSLPPLRGACRRPYPLVNWLYHYMNLLLYSVLYEALKGTKDAAILPEKLRYRWNRRIESFEYGSGLDYQLSD